MSSIATSPSRGTPPAAPAVLPPLTGGKLVAGTIALAAATFMIVLDTSIANVSIPAISGDMGLLIQWGGGGSYTLGGGGTIWHTGNLLPILNVRIVAGSGGVATGVSGYGYASGLYFVTGLTMGQLQAQNPNGWYAVSGG